MEQCKLPERPGTKRIALVFQGGGALGAYQAGVYQALEEHGYAPDWVAGTSIGAINGAIIAGNPVGSRIDRLDEFWRTVSRVDFWGCAQMPDGVRQIGGFWSAMGAMVYGQPGFFSPRAFPPLAPAPTGSAEIASFYDTGELRRTLLRLVDFDHLNAGNTRLSVGAVHVTSGRLRYFDSEFQRIGPEHLMASGALPPGFPAVSVDGELYWDGGIYSNTPLEVVLDDVPRVDTLCFLATLFDPVGPEPRSIPEVLTRHKDITYASRAQRHIEAYARTHNLRRAVRALYARLPEEVKKDPEMKALAELGCHTTMDIIHLGYGHRKWELATKDADFSWTSIKERWEQGYRDAARALRHSSWVKPPPAHVGVVLHEVQPEEA